MGPSQDQLNCLVSWVFRFTEVPVLRGFTVYDFVYFIQKTFSTAKS